MRCRRLSAALAAISMLACDESDCSTIASTLCQGIIWPQQVHEAANAASHVLTLKNLLLEFREWVLIALPVCLQSTGIKDCQDL